MGESKFKSVEGSFVLKTNTGGSMTYSIYGPRVPDDIAKVPEYIAELTRKELTGATVDEVEGFKKQIKELQATIDKKIEEINGLKKIAKGPVKSGLVA